jgi:RNA polymerase sigma factor (sigma-70 family)
VHSQAIDTLYRAHGHVVLRRARSLLGNEEDAHDVLQEVFASLVDRPTQIRGESSVATWLYSATTHSCLNRLRNQRTRKRLLLEHPPAPAERAAPRAETAAIVKDLFARIPPDLAEAAIYFYADEMTHDEIARVLGCSRRHVGDLLTRLRALIEGQEISHDGTEA